ncbi:MAG: hypothetical protein WCF67_17550, partial [Chitinophagaceae bacterium]
MLNILLSHRFRIYPVDILTKGCVLFFLFINLSSFHAYNPKDAVDVLHAKAKGRLSKEGVLFMKQNFIHHID